MSEADGKSNTLQFDVTSLPQEATLLFPIVERDYAVSCSLHDIERLAAKTLAKTRDLVVFQLGITATYVSEILASVPENSPRSAHCESTANDVNFMLASVLRYVARDTEIERDLAGFYFTPDLSAELRSPG